MYTEAKGIKDSLQEKQDFLNNELKLIKDVNAAFRIENNKLVQQYTETAKQLEETKIAQFQLNETNIKIKKDNNRLSKQMELLKEEKELAEQDFLEKYQRQQSASEKQNIFGGKTAFQVIQEEALIASQSEYRKLVSEQTESLANQKKEIDDLQE